MAVHVEPFVPLRTVTVQEYTRMGEVGLLGEDERVELLRGAIVEMPPPSEEHDNAIQWLTMKLVPLAIDAGVSVRVQSAIVFSEQDSVPMPDLVILQRRDRSLRGHPTTADVAIEVSVSSLRLDLRLKAGLYAEAGIAEYWVVDVVGRRILRHAHPRDGTYTLVETLDDDAVLRSTALPSFPGIPVADVFDGAL